MVRIDISGFYHTFDNDLEIVEALVTEQSVFCLPGKCFNIPNFFRIGKKESQKNKNEEFWSWSYTPENCKNNSFQYSLFLIMR